jgi:hypothetical protein
VLIFIKGMAIWSTKSDLEIQKEAKRALLNKNNNIPRNIAMVITAVYLGFKIFKFIFFLFFFTI